VQGEIQDGYSAAYITGVGVVSPVGMGRKAFWTSLLANESGVGPITLFDARDYEVRIAARPPKEWTVSPSSVSLPPS
jgi:3-oxoacyl-[acyl-carrier-protein] synthase II